MASPGRPNLPHVTIPTDSPSTSSNDASSISTSLNRLSINPTQSPRHRSPSPMARTSGHAQTSSPGTSSRPGTRNGPPGSVGRPPASPQSARKISSPLVSRRDSHGAPASPSLRRKSSATFSVRSSSQNRAPPSPVFERPPVTAASVATEHFTKELLHHNLFEPSGPDTIVIVHDACYGHRFSRPKVPKSTMGLIVERPERLQAGTLGLSSAYVRLGERHSEGSNPIHPSRDPSSRLPFRILKSTRSTSIVAPVVANVHGAKWTAELKQMADAAESRLRSGTKELTRPDTPTGNANKPHLHEGDLYLCKDSLEAFQGAIGGVLDAVDTVFGATASGADTTKAFVCVRPPGHHCSSDHPSGFCWLNNVHIGIEHAAQAHGLTHAAIIDFDLHHGDGSQSIAWERNAKAAKAPKNAPLSKKTSIGYYSLHDINSYPCEWGDVEKVQSASLCIENAHAQSIWNVHLQPWKDEDEFWALYESRYLVLLEKARAFLRHHTQRLRSEKAYIQPKAAIFISAGFDASEHEGEGMQRHKVTVPTTFYARFTSDIVKLAYEDGIGVDGRVISVLEGGYSDRALMSGVLSHLVGLTQTTKVHPQPSLNSTWWSLGALAELEALLRPSHVLPISVKKRPNEQGNYASPTQSFSAKVVDPDKMYRSISGTMRPVDTSRPPTPPAPEVDWATAAHELGKLLIPKDRPVISCRHDELNEPKPKKERHSSIGLPSVEPTTERVTRGRKAKADSSTAGSAASSKGRDPNRRRTISDLSAPGELVDFGQAIPSIESSTRPSTSAGSPTKNVFGGGDASSTTSRRSSLSRNSTPSQNATAPIQTKSRRSSGAGIGVAKRPTASREPSHMSIKEESPFRNDINVAPVPAAGDAPPVPSASSVDQLASRVKKITLHPPKLPGTTDRPAGAEKNAAKPVRKTPAPRAPKATATAVKTTASRTTAKTSKPAPGSKLPSAAIPHASPSEPLTAGQSVSSATSALIPNQTAASTAPAAEADPFHATPSTNAATITAPEVLPMPPPSNVSTNPLPSPTIAPSSSTNAGNEGYDPQFIPYQPPQPHSQATAPTPESLTWMTPHTAAQGTPPPPTPAAARGRTIAHPQAANKENLYVGNAMGPIPFSPRKESPAVTGSVIAADSPVAKMVHAEDDKAPSVWDVPPTPAAPQPHQAKSS
ncbi:hypothetical protein FH972_026139 [Carpinus fangiana]|uniref:Histone deacetylase domain-containing protein n=1 Tax=Carpinus fangiana TaxID=176857 RepID=A0A5N6L333_9ROSI|nr:hypothetical protein FH972_026139 [Carpinus fangiana]